MGFSSIDYVVFAGYCLFIIGIGLWVSRDKKGHTKDSQDYFLASRSLPWWAVGASLIASNISAEQFIGMSGSGYALGLAISTYEWMAAATLLVVGKFFLPIYLKKGIYTMPQFLADRYNDTVRTFMAIFWLLVYVFVNLTSVIYLGALSIETVLGVDLIYAIIALALFSLLYSIYGGLTAVAWTDVVQVIFLVLGGLVTTYLALDIVGDGDVLGGLAQLQEEAPRHFNMILERGFMIPDGQGGTEDAYQLLPGISVLIGGMWIVNLSYWGFNQYITQRALAAKSLDEAQKGVMFAGFLKLLIPLIVVIPGIAAFVIVENEELGGAFSQIMTDPDSGFITPDRAYPSLLSLLPNGMKGVAFAALTAAIVSSLASMANSTATIFTMDIYRNYLNKGASEGSLVRVGRIVVVVSFVIACLVAPALQGLGQVFQYIQEYTGYVSPGVFAIFVFGVFWKKTTPQAALVAAVLTIPLSAALAFFFPNLPFIDRMGVVFLVLAAQMIVMSLVQSGRDQPNSIDLSPGLFKTSRAFNVGAMVIIGILVALYAAYW